MLWSSREANPFAPVTEGRKGYTFQLAANTVTRMSEKYGKWTTMAQCREMKEALIELDPDGTGRVPLVDFYGRGNVSGNWFFEERSDYLRDVGALDESSTTRGPQLIIPNYVQQPSNCLEVSDFYTVCCLKECESILSEVEREIRAPMASPARIVDVVQRLVNEDKEIPQNLTARMVSQLEAVAEQSGGQVRLHGRLFSQWLHYAFPHECPYPAKTADLEHRVMAANYRARTGKYPMMNREEVETYIGENLRFSRTMMALDDEDEDDGLLNGPGPDAVEVPLSNASETSSSTQLTEEEKLEEERFSQWLMEEELYVKHDHDTTNPRTAAAKSLDSGSFVGSLAQLGILIGGFVALRPFVMHAYTELCNGNSAMGDALGKKKTDYLKKVRPPAPASSKFEVTV